MNYDLMTEIQFASPLLIVAAMSIIILLADALTGKNKTFNFYLSILSLAVAFASAGAILLGGSPETATKLSSFPLSNGMISYKGLAYIFDLIFTGAALLTIVAGREYIKRAEFEYKEFYSLVLLSTAGMMMIAHSNDLLLLFIGIELMSISFYVVAGYFRERISSVEAALKYFLLGAFASGFLLYGIAMIYGATGSIEFSKISEAIVAGNFDKLYITLGLGLTVIGLSFKIAAFPFHQWAPDVYSGAPTISTAFMSTAGKAAAVFAFVLIGLNILHPNVQTTANLSFIPTIQIIIAIISAATMLIGNITAISQNNIKRMLAYSSVAHAGYMLIGIASNNSDGFAGVAFYSMSYMLMQIGAFVIAGILEGKDGEFATFEHYNGLSRRKPVLAALMAVFMFSLAGIPPFAGFFGKYFLFKSAISAGFTWLALIAVLSSVISVYFYLRLIVVMYFKDSTNNYEFDSPKASTFTLLVTFLFVILLGLFPSYLIDLAKSFIN